MRYSVTVKAWPLLKSLHEIHVLLAHLSNKAAALLLLEPYTVGPQQLPIFWSLIPHTAMVQYRTPEIDLNTLIIEALCIAPCISLCINQPPKMQATPAGLQLRPAQPAAVSLGKSLQVCRERHTSGGREGQHLEVVWVAVTGPKLRCQNHKPCSLLYLPVIWQFKVNSLTATHLVVGIVPCV